MVLIPPLAIRFWSLIFDESKEQNSWRKDFELKSKCDMMNCKLKTRYLLDSHFLRGVTKRGHRLMNYN